MGLRRGTGWTGWRGRGKMRRVVGVTDRGEQGFGGWGGALRREHDSGCKRRTVTDRKDRAVGAKISALVNGTEGRGGVWTSEKMQACNRSCHFV